MKALVDKLRTWLKPWPTGTHPLEIHRAVLEEIEGKAVAAGAGKRVFPFNRLDVRLLAASPGERDELEAVARDAWNLEAEVRERLRARGCQIPAGLEVTVAVTEEGGADFGERRYHVGYRRAEGGERPGRRPLLELTVLEGTAARKVYSGTTDRVNVGRLAEVVDENGRLRRRNDIAFLDEPGVNQTVSREHARIAWDAESSGFWLRDEGSAYGTRIVRDGRPIEVSGSDRQGVRLKQGDEVSFGRARVKVGLRTE